MTKGTVCYCVNPDCLDRRNYFSYKQKICKSCKTPLIIQPHNILLTSPLSGFQENTNSEIFTIENLNIDSVDYPQVIKILRPNCGAIALRLFQQEGFLLQQLQGKFVPRVEPIPHFIIAPNQENRHHQNLHCLVMEQIMGESLEKKFVSNQLTTEIALDWLQQIAEILTSIHQQNIIHRDIKPSNIMVRENEKHPYGELVLIDFGTAQKFNPTDILDVAVNNKSTRIFSPGYTAPEQAQGTLTPQSDLYAVGRTFMSLLTGIHPDEVDYETLNWRKLIPHHALRQLLLSLTAMHLNNRLPDAKTFLQVITKILDQKKTSSMQVWLKQHRQTLIKKGAIAIGSCFLIGLSFKPIFQQITNYNYRQGFMLFTEVSAGGSPYDMNQLNQIKNWYQKALFFDSKHIDSYMGKGYICDFQRDFYCASEAYKKVIHYSQDPRSRQYILATNNKSLLEIKNQRNINQAIINLKRILPDAKKLELGGFVHKNLAWGYLVLDDLKEGEYWLNMADQEIPNNRDVKCLKQAVEVSKATKNKLSVAHCDSV